MLVEHVYRYPRRITWPIELLCTLLVGWAAVAVGRDVLLLVWQRWAADPFILKRIPQLADLVAWMSRTGTSQPSLTRLVPTLAILGGALLATLLVRSAFPAIRFSIRGLLIWFGNDWVPVQWEGLRALRVTDSPSGKRFVVLVQTDGKQLTPYHRVYSFLYRFGLKRGFLISSTLRDGEGLLREMMAEIERRRKLGDKLNVNLEDQGRSPLFSVFVNPTALLGRGNAAKSPVFQPVATAATMGNAAVLTMPSMGGSSAGYAAPSATPAVQAPLVGDSVQTRYPRAIELAFNSLSIVIVGFALWRYLDAWRIFLRYIFPSLERYPLFNVQAVVISPWGLLIGAHLGLVFVGAVLLMLRHLLPDVTVDSNGIVLSAMGKAHRLTWEQVKFVKATDVRDEQHVVLIEAEGKSLPWYFVMGSWLYDGGTGRGALIWPMIQPFEPLMQRMALELTRRQQPEQPVRLRDDAPGWLLMLALRPADALDRLVIMTENEADGPPSLEISAVLRSAMSMVWNGLGPAALLLTYWMMYKGLIFSLQVPVMLIFALLWGMAEWPLASLLASSLDQVVGAGNKGYRGLYLYPTAQLPRLLPLILAIILTLMGFPNLALVVWAAGIAWSGLLTAGLWESLYGWRGFPLLGGAFMTVFFQLLTFLGVLVLRG